MIDNGLLKYYPEYFDEFGRLQYFRFRKINEKSIPCHDVKKAQLKDKFFTKVNLGTFYYEKDFIEDYSYINAHKDKANSEILLSQIFANEGFNTAIYLPTVSEDKITCAVSNDISKPNSMLMVDYVDLAQKTYENFKNPFRNDKSYSPKELCLQTYFKEKALRDYVKMHVLDVACGNIDRDFRNFIVDVEEDENNLPIIQDIRLFDYAQAGLYSYPEYSYLCFVNGLGNGKSKNMQQMIEEFKSNELVNRFYSPSELSEMLGNIDVVETARDIKQTINYEIDDGLVTKFARLIDDTAEGLIK